MKVQKLKSLVTVVLIFLFTLGLGAQVNTPPKKKAKVIKHEVLEFLNTGIVHYKGVPYTGESWAYFDKPRKIHEKFTWLNGSQHGPYVEYNEVGTIIAKDTWSQGKKHGGFDYRYGMGQRKAKGTFKNGRLHGQVWGWYYTGTPKYYGNYSNGVRNGKNITYFKDGDVEQIAYLVDGKPQGTIFSYYTDSILRSEIEFRDGVKNGYSYKYHRSGCPAEESYYNNGQLDSIKRVYGEIGCRLIAQSSLKNGKNDGRFLTFDFTGDTLLDCTYVAGVFDGSYKAWHGKHLETIGRYSLGEPIGYWYYNLSSGLKMRHGRYLDGKMSGKWYFYDVEGYLLLTNVYDEDGDVIKQKFYKRKRNRMIKYPHKNERK